MRILSTNVCLSAVLTVLCAWAAPSWAQAPLSAFPGAVGFGAEATGGRGGTVYHVTNLNDAGPGSFRDAVSQGRRTVVFDIGGYITLKSPVTVQSDITLAGQTAPGDGIGVTGQEVSFSRAHNIIVRYMRFRQGLSGRRGQSSLSIFGGSDMIFDHVSVNWGRWDTIDMNKGADFTFQNCIIGPGVNPQRFGCLCQSDDVTFTRCLWIDNQSRNPKAKGRIQYINNVVYNWGVDGFVGGHSAADHQADLINSVFIQGPSSNDRFVGEFTTTDHLYQSGNLADLDRDGQWDPRPVTAADFGTTPKAPTMTAAPLLKPGIAVPVETPQKAYAEIVARAGDSRPRDAVDARLIAQVTSLGKDGSTIEDPALMGGPGVLRPGVAPRDTDGDGIPDAWERRHGLDPHRADDAERLDGHSGYTDLEDYINGLADGDQASRPASGSKR